MNNAKDMTFSCGAAAVSMGHTNEPTAIDKFWAPISAWFAKWTGEVVEETTDNCVVATRTVRRDLAA